MGITRSLPGKLGGRPQGLDSSGVRAGWGRTGTANCPSSPRTRHLEAEGVHRRPLAWLSCCDTGKEGSPPPLSPPRCWGTVLNLERVGRVLLSAGRDAEKGLQGPGLRDWRCRSEGSRTCPLLAARGPTPAPRGSLWLPAQRIRLGMSAFLVSQGLPVGGPLQKEGPQQLGLDAHPATPGASGPQGATCCRAVVGQQAPLGCGRGPGAAGEGTYQQAALLRPRGALHSGNVGCRLLCGLSPGLRPASAVSHQPPP